jgi:hypothetical protein
VLHEILEDSPAKRAVLAPRVVRHQHETVSIHPETRVRIRVLPGCRDASAATGCLAWVSKVEIEARRRSPANEEGT